MEPHHASVGQKGKDAGCVMEQVWLGAYRTTQHGFMSRTDDMAAAHAAFDGDAADVSPAKL